MSLDATPALPERITVDGSYITADTTPGRFGYVSRIAYPDAPALAAELARRWNAFPALVAALEPIRDLGDKSPCECEGCACDLGFAVETASAALSAGRAPQGES